MLSFFQSEMDSLIAFAKKPRDAQELTTFKYRIRVFGFAFLLNIVLILLASLGISALELAGIIDSENHQVQLLLKTFHPALVFVFAVFLGPILEEFVFRFGLRYNKFVPLVVWNYIKSANSDQSAEEAESRGRLKWNRLFPALFYSSSLVFAFIHIFNFGLSGWAFIFTPILVLPQFITGFLCGYLRVKFNFAYSMLLHIFNNGLFVGITFAMMWANGNFNFNQITKSEVIDNENYYLKIEVVENVYDHQSTTKVDYKLLDDYSTMPMDEYYKVNAKTITIEQVKEIKSERINSIIYKSKSERELSPTEEMANGNNIAKIDYKNATKRFNIIYNSKKSGMRNRDTLFKHFERITGEKL